MEKKYDCELILALDLETREKALKMLDHLEGSVDWVKVGLQLFTAYGPDFVREIADRGHKIFLDLKLHDIPNTVAKAVQSIASLPVQLLTIHSSGGQEMMEWAQDAASDYSERLSLLAVTVLTSMNQEQLHSLNVQVKTEDQVLHLAKLSASAGIPGLVCSPLEIDALREQFGRKPLIVTPGIRPAGAVSDEQKRIMTPKDAAAAGSDFIVVGRPILKAEDPATVARAIRAELKRAG